jgi:hypothetical protein
MAVSLIYPPDEPMRPLIYEQIIMNGTDVSIMI